MSGFSGQGKVLVGLRQANGQPGLMRWVGNASKCTLVLTQDDAQRAESFSGNRLPYRQMTKTRKGELTIVFDEFSTDNLALMTIAAVTTVAAGAPVTNYAFPVGAKVGSYLVPPAKNLTGVAVKDSSGKTLALDTNYRLNPFSGSAELIDLTAGGAFVQPFKMDYTPGAYTKVGAFNQPTSELYVRFEGVNTDDGTAIVADIYRARLKPVKDIMLIGEDYHDFELSGSVLADLTRQAASADGQYYSINTL